MEDGVDRFGDEDGTVVADIDAHAFRQTGADHRQRLLHRLGDIQRVGGGLLDDTHRDGVAAVEPGVHPLVPRADLRPADIAQADQIAGFVAQDDVLELGRRPHVGFRHDGELALDALHPARRDLDILAAQRRFDVLRRHPVGRQPRRVEPDPHRVAPLAEDPDIGDAGQVLKPVLDETVGVVGDVQRRVAVAGEGQIDDRLGVGLHLGDDRLVDLVRQGAAHAADPVADVVGRHVGLAGDPEADGDLAGFRPADRRHHVDALDAGQAFLQRLGHLTLDDLGAGALVLGRDGDDRLVDLGVFAHRQALIGHDADQQHGQAHDGGEDGTADAQFGHLHGGQLPTAGTTVTGAPSRIFRCPAVTITSPGDSPSRISTLAARRSPVRTLTRATLPSTTLKTN